MALNRAMPVSYTPLDVYKRQYQEKGLLDLGMGKTIEDAVCSYDKVNCVYLLKWKDIEGGCYSCRVSDLADEELRKAERCCLPAGETDIRDSFFSDREDCPEGGLPGNLLSVEEAVAERLKCRFLVPENIANEVPERVSASSPEDWKEIKAAAKYSDGTSVEKRVDWYTKEVDFNRPGTCLLYTSETFWVLLCLAPLYSV